MWLFSGWNEKSFTVILSCIYGSVTYADRKFIAVAI